MIKDINTKPDIHDLNFHCESCNVDYNSKDDYRQHLRAVHFMALKRIILQQNTKYHCL